MKEKMQFGVLIRAKKKDFGFAVRTFLMKSSQVDFWFIAHERPKDRNINLTVLSLTFLTRMGILHLRLNAPFEIIIVFFFF